MYIYQTKPIILSENISISIVTHFFTHWGSLVYKWKNHFYEMKGDVGMSVHEKERKQEDAYTKTQTHS